MQKRQNILQSIALSDKLNNHALSAYVKTDLYMQLLKLSHKLALIDVHYCNGTRYTETEQSYTQAVEKVYLRLETLLNPLAIYFYHQADPRGASLYVDNSPLNARNYTNGLAIY